MKGFKDYYYGYEDEEGKRYPGYMDMMDDLTSKFPLSEPQIIGEQNQKDFISLFGAILRMRNLLSAFDEFAGKEMISERDLQDYLGRYQDLRDEWNERRKRGEGTDIIDDIVFERNTTIATVKIRKCLSQSKRLLMPALNFVAKRHLSKHSLPESMMLKML